MNAEINTLMKMHMCMTGLIHFGLKQSIHEYMIDWMNAGVNEWLSKWMRACRRIWDHLRIIGIRPENELNEWRIDLMNACGTSYTITQCKEDWTASDRVRVCVCVSPSPRWPRCPVGKYWHYHGERCGELVSVPLDPALIAACLVGSVCLVGALLSILTFINRKCIQTRKAVTLV